MGTAPPMEWLVYELIHLGVPGLLAADGGLGKSFLALMLCLLVAQAQGARRRTFLSCADRSPSGRSCSSPPRIPPTRCTAACRRWTPSKSLRDGAHGRLFIVALPGDNGGDSNIVATNGYGSTKRTVELNDILPRS